MCFMYSSDADSVIADGDCSNEVHKRELEELGRFWNLCNFEEVVI